MTRWQPDPAHELLSDAHRATLAELEQLRAEQDELQQAVDEMDAFHRAQGQALLQKVAAERGELQAALDACVPGEWWRIEQARADKAIEALQPIAEDEHHDEACEGARGPELGGYCYCASRRARAALREIEE